MNLGHKLRLHINFKHGLMMTEFKNELHHYQDMYNLLLLYVKINFITCLIMEANWTQWVTSRQRGCKEYTIWTKLN